MCPQPVTGPNASQPQSKQLTNFLQGRQYQSKNNPYYSKVRMPCTSTSGTAFVMGAGQEFSAFAYARGQDMAGAGFPSGTTATPADTNIMSQSQTIAGEALEIHGIGLILQGTSDANLALASDENISVRIKINGTTEYLFGNPTMIPAPGGFFGSAAAPSVAPSLADQLSRNIGAMSNGIPHCTNFYPFEEPMLWVQAGQGDSTLNVIFKSERATTTNAGYGSAARAEGTGVAPYTPPASAGLVYVQWMVVLVGRTINPLSTN